MANMEAYIQKKPVETQQSQEVGEEAFMEEFGMKDSRSRAYQAGCGVSPYEVRSSLSLSSRSQRVRERKEREAKEREEREAERLRVHEEKLTARFEAKFQGRLENLENDMDRRVGMEVQKQMAAINWNASMSQEYRQMYGTQFQHGPALSWPFPWTMPGGDTPHSIPHPHMTARIEDPYLTTSRSGDYRPDMSFVSRENDCGDDDAMSDDD